MSKLTRALAELAKRADAGDEAARQGIRAYHGSPYSFDEFSTSQIGTGEGAQAYGRGLYFAESEDVARQYKNNLSRLRKEATIGGEPIDDPVLRAAIEITSFDDGTVDIGEAIKFAEDNARVSSGKSSLAWQAAADKMRGVNPNEVRVNNPGRMYEVNIDANPDELLDWDKPLSEQSELVRKAVNDMGLSKAPNIKENPNFPDDFGMLPTDDPMGSELLSRSAQKNWAKMDQPGYGEAPFKAAGIKGIRYKDGFSRGSEGGSSNYVIFDDRLISIAKKYGVSILIAAKIAEGIITPEEAQAGPGSKALAELAKRADAGDQAAVEGIRAYHGSPHSFDKFSSENIGTGEGAQAFGHGLYFAEEEAVAKAYRDALKGRMVTTSDGVTKTYGQHITEVEDAIRAAHPNLNPDNIRAAAKSVVDDNLTDADVEGMGQWEGVYKSGIVANKNAQASKGSMYEVKIDAAAEDFLNWQTPLREQKKLLSALDDQYGDHEIVLQQLGLDIKYETPTGGDLAMALGMTRGGQTAPPRLLTDAGLKGVKYPAAFTRQKSPDKQSFNYVVFDDKLIDITKKYGVSIPAAAAIAAGTMTPEEAQASTPQDQQASEYSSLGGMGVRMPPTAEDEEAMLAPTGGDLMQQANRDFADSIRTQPEPDFLTGVQQSLLSGIMKTAGVADLSADIASAMAGPLLSAPGAIARYAADRYVPGVNYTAEEMAQGRRETEDYFNYQPRTEQGPQYGEQIMQGIGGAIAPYVPAIKKAAGDSYILGAMRQGYDYLGEREKELAKALMDLSPI
jgi:hypothetical protein